MKKIIIGGIILVVLGSLAGAAYYFFRTPSRDVDTRPPKDLTGIVVPPVVYPMKGKTFFVPNATSTSVVLDLVAPTARYDYPMGRYAGLEAGSVNMLTAQDDLATDASSGIQAVPIVVTEGETQTNYLAILAGEKLEHVDSLPIGQMIKIQNVTREGSKVTVNYLVHDRAQVLTEVPRIATTAIFDIADKKIIQAGRTPATETYVETKSFSGEYLWRTTKFSDGKTVTPSKPDVFTLLFDANRISLGTDCNTGGTTYVAETGSTTSFTVEPIASTKMFCEPGQEGEYFSMVQTVIDYDEDADGDLLLILKDDAVMTFAPKTKALEFAATSTNTQ